MEYLFIDFDGVICDSVDEAFVSSWYALKKRKKSVNIRDHALFCSYRPYIKSGADFILLQRCLEKNIHITGQKHYNRIYSGVSRFRRRRNHKLFYRARTWLLQNQRDFWFGQNRLYEGMKTRLEKLADRSDVFILSTKKSAFILEILEREGISWPAERVLYSSSTEKIPIIESYLAEKEDKAILIDDQGEYFREHDRINFYLAAWGYVADPDSVRYAEVLELPGIDRVLGI